MSKFQDVKINMQNMNEILDKNYKKYHETETKDQL